MLTMSNAKTDSTNGTMSHFVMPYSNNSISNGETNGHESQQQQIQNTLKQQNEMNDKKRKLTLPIPPMSNSTSSDSGSISSDSSSNNLANLINMGELNNAKLNGTSNASTLDSLIPQAKKLKSIYTHEGLINLTTLNETPSLTKDLVHHLDNNNISTPQIDKLLADFNASNYNLKTPGSALALLTPVNSLAHVFSQHSAADQQSILNLSNYAMTTPDDPNYNALQNNLLFNRTISEIAAAALTPSSAINPNNIFGSLQQQQNQINSNPKYTTLTNIQSTSSTASSSSSDATKTANDTGNYYLNVQQQSSNETNTSTGGSSSSSSSTVNYNNTNANTNLSIKIKDELQTVPVHPLSNNDKLNKTSTKKGKYNNSTAIKSETNAGNKRTSEMENMNIVELKPKDAMNNMGAMALTNRRDTDNSTTSSNNLESNNFSPINLSDQEALKLEKKRERNREAARKCRTRKLEKIEQLQQKVQELTDTNKQERAKNMALSEELNKIRQKLENHQKLNNCDLNMNL
jgi:transcription factor AP-1